MNPSQSAILSIIVTFMVLLQFKYTLCNQSETYFLMSSVERNREVDLLCSTNCRQFG